MNIQSLPELLVQKGKIAAALSSGFSPDEIFILVRCDGIFTSPNRVRKFCAAISATSKVRRWRRRL